MQKVKELIKRLCGIRPEKPRNRIVEALPFVIVGMFIGILVFRFENRKIIKAGMGALNNASAS